MEDDPLLDESSGSGDEYALNKIALEKELAAVCAKEHIAYTILRPTFVYGPLNYSPQESYFIELIARQHIVPVPVDSTAHFNFVYALDVARAVMDCIGDSRAHGEIFNLAGREPVTYNGLISDFERYNAGPFQTREVTLKQAEDEHIPLPFPLRDDVLCGGEKISRCLDFKYTPFAEGMEKTFRTFYSLYVS
jgi:nucleoside-diphosphate-sugar epimerase